MGMLALAGAVSGAGQGLSQGLTQLTGGMIQYGMMKEGQKFQSEKMQEQMAHAERLAAAGQEFTKGENAANRKETRELAGEKMTFEQGQSVDKQVADDKRADADRTSKETIAKEGNLSAEKINDAKNKISLDIAKIDRDVKKEQVNATELTAAGEQARGMVSELNVLRGLAANQMQTKEEKAAFNVSITELERKVETTRQLAMARMQKMQTDAGIKQPEPVAAPEKKSFQSPAARKERGTIQVPPTSMTEQGMMQRAIAQ